MTGIDIKVERARDDTAQTFGGYVDAMQPYWRNAKQNLTKGGGRTFVCDGENHLTSVSVRISATLEYGPLARLS